MFYPPRVSPKLFYELSSIYKEAELLEKEGTGNQFTDLQRKIDALTHNKEIKEHFVSSLPRIQNLAKSFGELAERQEKGKLEASIKDIQTLKARMKSIIKTICAIRPCVTGESDLQLLEEVRSNRISMLPKIISSFRPPPIGGSGQHVKRAVGYGVSLENIQLMFENGWGYVDSSLLVALFHRIRENSSQLEDIKNIWRFLKSEGFDPNTIPEHHKVLPLTGIIQDTNRTGQGVPSAAMQMFIDEGGIVNVTNEQCPYLDAVLDCMNDRVSGKDDSVLANRRVIAEPLLQMLLFNGAIPSPETEKQMRADPQCLEMLNIRDEALRRMSSALLENTLKDLEWLKAFPEVLLKLESDYATSDSLAFIARDPDLRNELFRNCRVIQEEKRAKAAGA